MKQTPSQLIRERIHQAQQQEARSHAFRDLLALVAPRMHKAVQLPKNNPHDALFEFTCRYLQNVPDFLEALTHCMKEARIYSEGKIFIRIAEEFFAASTGSEPEPGLQHLLDKAYLAHRLIEEINDRLIMLCGEPLAPMDMTMSNIIVHELLGETFANQLDLAVHYTVELLFNPEDLAQKNNIAEFMNGYRKGDWRKHLAQWPCFAEDCSLSILLDPEQPPQAVH